MVGLDRWLVWAFWHDGTRWAKQPRHHARSGTNIDHTDPANLVALGEAAAAFYRNRRYESRDNVRLDYANPRFQLDGFGFMFLKQDPFAGIDLDKCVTPRFDARGRFSYEIDDWALPVLGDFGDCYAELSPSLTGLKIFVAAKLDPGRTGGKFPGPDGRGAIEVYDAGRFFAVTGLRLPPHPPALGARGPELNALYARLDAARTPPEPAPHTPQPLPPPPTPQTVPNRRGAERSGAERRGRPTPRSWTEPVPRRPGSRSPPSTTGATRRGTTATTRGPTSPSASCWRSGPAGTRRRSTACSGGRP
jgi:hypothetical protein